MRVVFDLGCMLVNIWLAACTTGFYIMVYGDGSKVVHRWPMVGSFALRFGMVLIIVGSMFDALSWRNNSFSAFVSHAGLALVFTWAYKYHKTMFTKGV